MPRLPATTLALTRLTRSSLMAPIKPLSAEAFKMVLSYLAIRRHKKWRISLIWPSVSLLSKIPAAAAAFMKGESTAKVSALTNGDVDRVAGRSAVQHVDNLLGDIFGRGIWASVVEAPRCGVTTTLSLLKSGLFRGRFFGKNIEGRAGDFLLGDGFGQQVFVNQAAPGAVDNANGGFH